MDSLKGLIIGRNKYNKSVDNGLIKQYSKYMEQITISNGGRKMNKFEVLEKIMGSEKLKENEKVNTIKTFLLGWLEEDDLKWIWE